MSKKQKKKYIYLGRINEGILNRIAGLSGTTDDFRL